MMEKEKNGIGLQSWYDVIPPSSPELVRVVEWNVRRFQPLMGYYTIISREDEPPVYVVGAIALTGQVRVVTPTGEDMIVCVAVLDVGDPADRAEFKSALQFRHWRQNTNYAAYGSAEITGKDVIERQLKEADRSFDLLCRRVEPLDPGGLH